MAKRRPRARAPELRGEAGEAGEAQAVPAATRRAPAEDPARYPDPPRKPKAHSTLVQLSGSFNSRGQVLNSD